VPATGGAAADPFGIVGRIVDGRYRIEAAIGAGGFGVVYRALHLGFDSPIALKVLRLPETWTAERKRARIGSFQREGKLLFKLSSLHGSIVRAFETGAVTLADGSGAPYLALEWLDGVSLATESSYRRCCGLAPLALPEVLQLLDDPAAAIARAHGEGIVHRDIKPANLFVTFRDGEPHVKVLDFGVAKIIEDVGADAAALPVEADVPPASTSAFTPMYAAPEQWVRRLGKTGPWTDVHAWALVCVELVTGKRPLAGDKPGELMVACLDPVARPTPAAADVNLAPEIEAVFARALAVDPSTRYRDLASFWSALRQAAAWSPASRREVSIFAPRATVAPEPPAEPEGPAPAGIASATSSLGSLAFRPTSPALTAQRPGSGQRRRVLATIVGMGALLATGLAVGTRLSASRGWVAAPSLPARPGAHVDTPASAGISAGTPNTAAPPAIPTPSPPHAVAAGASPTPTHRAGDRAVRSTQRAQRSARGGTALVPDSDSDPGGERPATGLDAPLDQAEGLLGQGRIADACALGRGVAESAPHLAPAWNFLGRCYMRLGDGQRARGAYRKFLEVDPDSPSAPFVRAILQHEAR
jgi:serine/threonine protein kinase